MPPPEVPWEWRAEPLRRLSQTPAAGPNMDVVLYTRRGCHLCETVEDLLPHHAPDARIVEVGGDSDLEREYGLRVPVLVVDARSVAEGRIDEATLIVALAGASRDRD